MTLRPGEIYWVHTVEGKRRLVIVVSREELNRGQYFIAVPITSAKFKVRSRLPNCVPFRAGSFGFDRDCVAQAETLSLYHRSEIDEGLGQVGTLDDEAMYAVVRAVGYALAARCEPD